MKGTSELSKAWSDRPFVTGAGGCLSVISFFYIVLLGWLLVSSGKRDCDSEASLFLTVLSALFPVLPLLVGGVWLLGRITGRISRFIQNWMLISSVAASLAGIAALSIDALFVC